MHTYAIQPRRELQPYIERYWGWESPDQVELPVVLPGTGAELFFHYGIPFRVAPQGETACQVATAHLLCVRSRPYRLHGSLPLGFLAIRFRAGAFRHFCPLPLEELCDSTYEIGDIWGRAGQELAQRIGNAPTRLGRIQQLESYLLHCLSQYAHEKSHIDSALRQLYYHHDSIYIQSLVKQMGISRRHFERTFKAAIGVSPKLFHRLSRFQQTIRELLLTRTSDYLQIALAHGYYDQSHFIKEFRDFTQITPASFLLPTNFLAHFYTTRSPPHSSVGVL